MQDYHRAFVRRAILIPAALAGTLAVGIHAADTSSWQSAPTASASPADPIEIAEVTVANKLAAATAGRDCYADPTGRAPTHAVVKDDGTTNVRVLTAETAWAAAHDGDVWVLAWCSHERP